MVNCERDGFLSVEPTANFAFVFEVLACLSREISPSCGLQVSLVERAKFGLRNVRGREYTPVKGI